MNHSLIDLFVSKIFVVSILRVIKYGCFVWTTIFFIWITEYIYALEYLKTVIDIYLYYV